MRWIAKAQRTVCRHKSPSALHGVRLGWRVWHNDPRTVCVLIMLSGVNLAAARHLPRARGKICCPKGICVSVVAGP